MLFDPNAISDGDLETFSEVDITKTSVGPYAMHPSTEVLMYCWINPGEKSLNQWLPEESEMPAELVEIINDPKVIFAAWNAAFEYNIFKHVLGMHIPIERWYDPMALAHTCSLPGSLKKAGQICNLDDRYLKQESGTRLINKFSKPRRPSKNNPATRWTSETAPEDWELFKEYNRFDVRCQYAMRKRLWKFNPPDHEWEMWRLDQRINDTGLPVDMTLVDNALRMADYARSDLLEKAKEITGVHNPNSDAQLIEWFKANGLDLPNYQKETVQKALKGDLPPVTRDVLKMRAQWKKTSTRKFTALKQKTCPDGRLRGAFQYAGAGRTWRWAGRGVQLQNLPRGSFGSLEALDQGVETVREGDYELAAMIYDNVMDTISSVIRPAFRAPEGYKMIIADLSAIESRVLGWLSRCKKTMDCFNAGRDPYKDFAVDLFGTPYDEVTKRQRTESKPAVLGCFAGDTPVLTLRGWVEISSILDSDLVFDGDRFVEHNGLIYQGEKETINLDGVRVTPDHKILCKSGWKEAWKCADHGIFAQSALSLASGKLKLGEKGATDKQITWYGALAKTAPTHRCGETARALREGAVRNVETVEQSSYEGDPNPGTESVYDLFKVGPSKRFMIKTDSGVMIVSNCGYRLGGGDYAKAGDPESMKTGLWGYAENMGIKMDKELSHKSVEMWRSAHPEVVQLWANIDDAAKQCIKTKMPIPIKGTPCSFDYEAPFMRMRLPSGRCLHYMHPKITMETPPWERGKAVPKRRPAITYSGLNDQSQWVRIVTHGGKFVENVTQAIARDILCVGLEEAEKKGFEIIGHVHDEIITVVPNGSELTVEDLCDCMTVKPAWAQDLPLGAAGFESQYFRKD